MSVSVDRETEEWLIAEAELCRRSKARHVEWILHRAHQKALADHAD